MLQAAKAARNTLDDATGSVVDFLRSRFNEDGGAKDRSGKSDLYYTVFALEGLLAMQADPPIASVVSYLRGFGDGDRLDFVHQSCLARCWASVPDECLDPDIGCRILQHIESHRSDDGGYGGGRDDPTGTVYHCFLALGVYQDLQGEIPNPDGLQQCLDGLRTDDGAYANDHDMRFGTTPATAAAATLMRHLGKPIPHGVADWLIGCCRKEGGFLAMPLAPFPDLLSTATALHALAGMGVCLDKIREPCLDFLDTLWTGRAFRGHIADDTEDCEYTYYAILALGQLSS